MAEPGVAAYMFELEKATANLREAVTRHAPDYLEHLEARQGAIERIRLVAGELDEQGRARLEAALNQGEWIVERLREDRMKIRGTFLRLGRRAEWAERLKDGLRPQTVSVEVTG